MAPRNQNQAKKHKQHAVPDTADHRTVPVELQQLILNVFTQGIPAMHGSRLRSVVQEVKGHLYNRDFVAAFSKQDYLDAYALRWSAARALAYTEIFMQPSRYEWFLPKQTSGVAADAQGTENVPLPATTTDQHARSLPTKVVCIGGGAGAEIVALAAMSRATRIPHRFNIVAIDIADWTNVVNKLQASMGAPQQLSVHATDAAHAANQPFVDPGNLSVEFVCRDILDVTSTSVTGPIEQQETPTQQSGDSRGNSLDRLLHGVTVCTMMFTLNELFSTSIAKTTALLLSLTSIMDPGSWLVIVDSPGSYSEIRLGRSGQVKKYPMTWLLDHALLEVAGEGRWTKMEDEESVWFRIKEKTTLTYPLELENTRFQLHVYRRNSNRKENDELGKSLANP